MLKEPTTRIARWGSRGEAAGAGQPGQGREGRGGVEML
jgi:hypothetical protein